MRPSNRLRSGSDIARTRSQGRRVTGYGFVLYHFAREAASPPRVGFSVSRRIGGAVVRNRARRRLREALRPLLPRLAACDVVVEARPEALEADLPGLTASFEEVLARAGLLQT